MQPSLHPHWQNTDDDERGVRITVAGAKNASPKKQENIALPRANRSPAAVVGVVLFLSAGAALFFGANGLLGQVASTDIHATITQDGIEPVVVTARPGMTIVWKNASGIPHILRSSTLPADNGEMFSTTAIFPQSTYSYTVPLTTAPGTYDYISGTAEHITGQILIEAPTSHTSTSIEPAQPLATASGTSSSAVSSSAVYSTSSTAVSALETLSPQAPITDTLQPLAAGVVPQNPHVVGSGDMPLPPRQSVGGTSSAAPLRPAATVTQHMPTANTQTGMEAWMLGIITVAALAGVTWKASKSV